MPNLCPIPDTLLKTSEPGLAISIANKLLMRGDWKEYESHRNDSIKARHNKAVLIFIYLYICVCVSVYNS